MGGHWRDKVLHGPLGVRWNRLASTIPEYSTVMAMRGVGAAFEPQLIAEIGDITRFTRKEALTAFASADSGVNESGKFKIHLFLYLQHAFMQDIY